MCLTNQAMRWIPLGQGDHETDSFFNLSKVGTDSKIERNNCDANLQDVVDSIVRAVDMPFWQTCVRDSKIDPSTDGAEVVNGVADRIRGHADRGC